MKRILFIFCLGTLATSTFAQKLPDVQATSLTAPTGVRIDGKYTDWNDTYAAENKRTGIFYSIANDDKNLYLIVKSGSSANANKIMLGGITFTINNDGKKRDKDGIWVTYPLVPRGNRNQFGRGGQGQNRQAGGQGGFQNRPQQSQEQRDSAALVMRKAALTTVKEIKIGGFKNIPDSLISIYNEYGIKAVASFDAKGAFVYELAIPLSSLELSSTKNEFAYQIKVNGMSAMNFGGGGGNFGGNFGGGNAGRGNGNAGGQDFQDLMSPTDFWGKYTLIKK